MNGAQQVLEAIKASGVTRIAFVDDAFDPPDFPEAQKGALLDFFTAARAEEVRLGAGIDPEDWEAAVADLTSGTDDTLLDVLRKLYSAYLREFDSKFDPMGQFATLKGGAGGPLSTVRPLLALVRQAAPDISVSIYGKDMDAVDDTEGPHVVFVDLFLDPGINPDEFPSADLARSAVEASIARIKPLLTLSPSVVLMSSHNGTQEATTYRRSIGGTNRVYASRFGFVDKHKLQEDGNSIRVAPEVSDVLLDLFQTYKFGRGLHRVLTAWVSGARKAVQALEDEIDGLDLADLAYLVRFRLAAEGQSLPEYLEWLLGECLVDEVGRRLDEDLPAAMVSDLGPEEARRVESAFDGPTQKVAELYHRVRIENRRSRPREHFRLGDLYLRSRGEGKVPNDLIVLMNPDCDLIRRPGQRSPSAHALLTLQGELQEFNAPNTSIGDFVVVDGVPHNIKWNYRVVETLPYLGVMERPGQDGKIERPSGEGSVSYQYLGALRPLYAQEIQANLLHNLGRVGVAVAPALAFDGQVILVYAEKSGKKIEPTLEVTGTPAYVVSARQSDQRPMIVFTRTFLRCLVAALSNIDVSQLADDAKTNLTSLLGQKGRASLVALTGDGLELGGKIYGILLTDKVPKLGGPGQPWCCIEISMKKSADDTLERDAVS